MFCIMPKNLIVHSRLACIISKNLPRKSSKICTLSSIKDAIINVVRSFLKKRCLFFKFRHECRSPSSDCEAFLLFLRPVDLGVRLVDGRCRNMHFCVGLCEIVTFIKHSI